MTTSTATTADIEIPLVSGEYMGRRFFELPAGTVLRGDFRHVGRRGRYSVHLFADADGVRDWCGEPRLDDDIFGHLSALCTVISDRPGVRENVIEVARGDVLVTPLGRFEICEPRQLDYPYLRKL